MYRVFRFACSILLSLSAVTAQAGSDPEVLLQARIAAPDSEPRSVAYARADLEALPQVQFTTATPWTTGAETFSGPSLHSVLADAGVTARSGTMILRASNDYFIEVPLEAMEPDVPIVATRRDGQPFSLREKGPLWILYPFDADETYRTDLALSRSVWQLVEIDVTLD
jgi:hypothetical protein